MHACACICVGASRAVVGQARRADIGQMGRAKLGLAARVGGSGGGRTSGSRGTGAAALSVDSGSAAFSVGPGSAAFFVDSVSPHPASRIARRAGNGAHIHKARPHTHTPAHMRNGGTWGDLHGGDPIMTPSETF